MDQLNRETLMREIGAITIVIFPKLW